MSCNVAFIGLGVMGYPMAGYISKAGHNVTVYNRTATKADKQHVVSSVHPHAGCLDEQWDRLIEGLRQFGASRKGTL
jgi:3-hydroxyisobutyrate dehydrogenase-like beta-hydroxyacid dehydrogenase